MKATFAAGCFWHVEALFQRIDGVTGTKVGYTDGTVDNPTYEQVCTDLTGHVEAVRIEYDPQRVSYERLLDVFWKNHDPTTPNRQGPDVGRQYRSAVFTHSPEQLEKATLSKNRLENSDRFSSSIVTDIKPAGRFYPAEQYHQRYFEKREFDLSTSTGILGMHGIVCAFKKHHSSSCDPLDPITIRSNFSDLECVDLSVVSRVSITIDLNLMWESCLRDPVFFYELCRFYVLY